MEVLVQDMDPGEVCALMGTCMEALVAVKAPALPAELVLALAGVHKMLMKPQGVQPSNDGCDYCKVREKRVMLSGDGPSIYGASILTYLE
jgi:hypothetical protein